MLTKDGAFALFFRPHPGGFDSSRDPTAGNLPFLAKKMANARGSARGGLGAAGNFSPTHRVPVGRVGENPWNLGTRLTRGERDPSRVSLARVRFLFRPLLPSACYAGIGVRGGSLPPRPPHPGKKSKASKKHTAQFFQDPPISIAS